VFYSSSIVVCLGFYVVIDCDARWLGLLSQPEGVLCLNLCLELNTKPTSRLEWPVMFWTGR